MAYRNDFCSGISFRSQYAFPLFFLPPAAAPARPARPSLSLLVYLPGMFALLIPVINPSRQVEGKVGRRGEALWLSLPSYPSLASRQTDGLIELARENMEEDRS